MGVDRRDDVLGGRLQPLGETHLGDQLRRVLADDVGAENLSIRLGGDDLDHAVHGPHRHRLAVTLELEGADAVVDALIPHRPLGQTDRGDLRVAVGAGGNRPVIDRKRRVALDALHAHHRLLHRQVCQPRRADHIADGVDPGDTALVRGLVPLAIVGLDVPVAQGQPEPVVEQALEPGGHAHRHEHDLAFDLLRPGLIGRIDKGHGRRGRLGGGLDLDGLHRVPGMNGHALPGEDAMGDSRDVVVLDGKDPVEDLHHGDVGAERVVEVGELHPDRPRAHDHHGLRPLRQVHRVIGRHDRLAVERREGKLLRRRAGGDEHVIGGERVQGRGAAGPVVVISGRLGHLDAAGALGRPAADDLRVTGDVIDAVLLEQETDAGVEDFRDAPAATDDGLPVDLDLLELDAPVGAVGHGLAVQLGVVKQRLAGDAAPVQTDTAELVALDARRFEAELPGPDRADVSRRSRANHNDVVVPGFRHAAVSLLDPLGLGRIVTAPPLTAPTDPPSIRVLRRRSGSQR